MKKIILVLPAFVLLFACHSDTSHDHGHNPETTTATASTTTPALPENELQLNDGKKWNADDMTQKNISNLASILSTYNDQQTLEDYKKAGEELQNGLDILVKQCIMKGPDHEALHLWLEPFMETVKAFKASNEQEEAGKLLTKLKAQMEVYPQYFE